MHKFIYMYFTQMGNSPLYFKLTHSGDDVQMDCYQLNGRTDREGTDNRMAEQTGRGQTTEWPNKQGGDRQHNGRTNREGTDTRMAEQTGRGHKT
jgi:hypothetical protein